MTNQQIVENIAEIETEMKKAEPKVDMIFLETASFKDTDVSEANPKHIG